VDCVRQRPVLDETAKREEYLLHFVGHPGGEDHVALLFQVLDGDVAVVRDIGFAGVKGFGSGFGRRVLEPWGESVMKEFVQVSVDEAMKLESALARLRTEHRIAILHYSPIVGTVSGSRKCIAGSVACLASPSVSATPCRDGYCPVNSVVRLGVHAVEPA